MHLAYGGHLSRLTVTWTTFDDVGDAFVHWGARHIDEHAATAATSRFVDGGKRRTVRYIHRATLTDIEAGQRYRRSSCTRAYGYLTQSTLSEHKNIESTPRLTLAATRSLAVYRVGSEGGGWSAMFTFVGLHERPEGGYK